MLQNHKVILKELSVDDAEAFYAIYNHAEIAMSFEASPFLENEEPAAFTNRIISLCQFIFSIRLTENPEEIIGDCALHDLDEQKAEIAIGGSLLPQYWGKGYMQAAFELLELMARQQIGVKTLVAATKTSNTKALCLAKKMGFSTAHSDAENTVLKKFI